MARREHEAVAQRPRRIASGRSAGGGPRARTRRARGPSARRDGRSRALLHGVDREEADGVLDLGCGARGRALLVTFPSVGARRITVVLARHQRCREPLVPGRLPAPRAARDGRRSPALRGRPAARALRGEESTAPPQRAPPASPARGAAGFPSSPTITSALPSRDRDRARADRADRGRARAALRGWDARAARRAVCTTRPAGSSSSRSARLSSSRARIADARRLEDRGVEVGDGRGARDALRLDAGAGDDERNPGTSGPSRSPWP